jgi:hypothetical protein
MDGSSLRRTMNSKRDTLSFILHAGGDKTNFFEGILEISNSERFKI